MSYRDPEDVTNAIDCRLRIRTIEEQRKTLCFRCHSEFQPVEVHGHVQCGSCGQVISSCCGDG